VTTIAAEKARWPGSRGRDASRTEDVLVSVIERSNGTQIRVSVVRYLGRKGAMVSVSVWYRDPFREGEDWQPNRRPWNGGPLIRSDEVERVAAAMQTAVDRARELGWSR